MSLSSLNTPVSPPASSEPSKKRRRAITNVEKIEIWGYFFDKKHPKPPSLKAVQNWYRDRHPHLPVAISSISEIVSSKYRCLDSNAIISETSITAGKYRLRKANYPDLEAALYEFQLWMLRKGAAISGDILKEMGGQIFDRLPQYASKERPKFSNGWLNSFKKWYSIQQRIQSAFAN